MICALLASADGFDERVVMTVIALGVAATMAAAVFTVLSERDRRRHGPTIRRVARGLGLGIADRRLLLYVAQSAGRRHAGSLLLSAGCFDAAAARYVARHGDVARLRALRQRIFD